MLIGKQISGLLPLRHKHRHNQKGGGQMNIQEQRNKNGEITSYRISVFNHRDTQTGRQIFRTLSVKYDHDKTEA